MTTDPEDPRARAPRGAGDAAEKGAQASPPRLEDLIRQHRALDEQLIEMARRPGLSPAEQVEEAMLKKRKLWLKDRIAALRSTA